MEPITYTLGQLADLLQVSAMTIRRKWSTGEFPAPIQFGRTIRWRRQDVEEWLKNQQPSELYERTDS